LPYMKGRAYSSKNALQISNRNQGMRLFLFLLSAAISCTGLIHGGSEGSNLTKCVLTAGKHCHDAKNKIKELCPKANTADRFNSLDSGKRTVEVGTHALLTFLNCQSQEIYNCFERLKKLTRKMSHEVLKRQAEKQIAVFYDAPHEEDLVRDAFSKWSIPRFGQFVNYRYCLNEYICKGVIKLENDVATMSVWKENHNSQDKREVKAKSAFKEDDDWTAFWTALWDNWASMHNTEHMCEESGFEDISPLEKLLGERGRKLESSEYEDAPPLDLEMLKKKAQTKYQGESKSADNAERGRSYSYFDDPDLTGEVSLQ